MSKDATTPYHGFVSFQARGVVTFPRELRERLNADAPGSQLEITERPDGVFELRPMVPVPADQKWFWTDRWQGMERKADAEIAAGRVDVFDDVDSFLADLDA